MRVSRKINALSLTLTQSFIDGKNYQTNFSPPLGLSAKTIKVLAMRKASLCEAFLIISSKLSQTDVSIKLTLSIIAMNPTEPNSADLNAIASDNSPEVDTSPNPPQNLGTFLDRLYGTLFLPQATFEQLKANPSFVQAAIVIALVNILENLRLDRFAILGIIWSVISGIIGWLFFTFLLRQLAGVFQKNVKLVELLTLTGFASLPWLFMAPALSLPSPFRILVAIAVIVWFVVWQVWSASIALEIKSRKAIAIVPLAIAGGVVALIWLGNTFKLLLSITW